MKIVTTRFWTCATITFHLLAGATLMMAQSTGFLGRGVTANGGMITEKDLADFAATGGNLVRLQFNKTAPLRDLMPPYAINQQNMGSLDRDLDWCKELNLNCVIAPQAVPGLEGHPNDPMWHDARFQEMESSLWETIATRVAQRGSEVAGLDLLNEPMIYGGAKKGSLGDYNTLVAHLVEVIRRRDTVHPIIIETANVWQGGHAVNWNDAFASYMAPPPDSNVIYSTHMYEPYTLTFGRQGPVDYPGMVAGKMWNSHMLSERLAEAAEFQRKYHVQIYLGEFGCVRWGGDACNRWLKDVIDYCEAHHWSWTYLNWRGHEMWDAEKNNYDQNDDGVRSASRPRMKLLQDYWKLGRKE